jgi:hypothetical protein
MKNFAIVNGDSFGGMINLDTHVDTIIYVDTEKYPIPKDGKVVGFDSVKKEWIVESPLPVPKESPDPKTIITSAKKEPVEPTESLVKKTK